MKRIAYEKYNPNLSIETNASKLGCSVAAIKKHFKTHGVDRRFDVMLVRWKQIHGFYQKNPNASLEQARSQLGYSINTIRKYKALSKEELFVLKRDTSKVSYFDKPQNTTIVPNKLRTDHPLASAMLADVSRILEFAEKADVAALRSWLLDSSTTPLICCGNGGKHTTYPALLYGMNAGIAKAITPLDFASISPTAISNSKVLLLSSSGKNMDVGYAIKRAMRYNPDNTAGFTFTDDPKKNKMIGALKPENIFCFKNPYKDGFISIRSKILTYALLYKAFSGCEKFANKLNLNPAYRYYINQEGNLPELKSIKHFVLLYGSYGEPVAHDVESVMVESGIASVQVCDYRNFCHGRFIFSGNHCQNKYVAETDVCAILLITPREEKIAKSVRENAFAKNMPIVEIYTELKSSLATIQLLLSALHFTFDLAENHHGINPNSPFNASGIDKRVPISQVRFSSAIQQMGELTNVEE